LRFTLTGLIALLCGTVWLLVHPEILAKYHYSPSAIAVTHLMVLGWIVLSVMGAMYQLVPVALETKLYSERLAKWQFAIHVMSVAGMVWMFHAWNMKQVGHFGCGMALSFGLFAYNIARTLLRAPKWNVITLAVASALFWLLFAALAGLSIAAGKCVYESADKYSATSAMGALLHSLRACGMFMSHFAPLGAMHAHAHLGAVGFFLMLIVGISYKLIPMFTLSEIQSSRRAVLSVALLNLGLAGSFVAILLQSRWKPHFALVLILALVFYGREIIAILRARKRLALDWGVRYFLTAICLLAPLSMIGLFLSRPELTWADFNGQLENLYGFLALIGVVSFAIIGMLYKIVPFLVWFAAYSRHIGRARVPALAEMYCTRLQAAGYWTYLAAIITLGASILFRSELGVRCGSILLVASLLTLATNIGLIFRHYFNPQLNPMPTTSTKAQDL
jgi:hypothetical protein